MFAGIYYGGMYGGSTTSILLNTPGRASVVTALEGDKMACAGRGGPALATAAIGSFVAGTIATLGLALGGQRLAAFVMAFRRGGLKTEPAFAAALKMHGDPYQALLGLDYLGDEVLARWIHQSIASL
jgi:hypothetical protein